MNCKRAKEKWNVSFEFQQLYFYSNSFENIWIDRWCIFQNFYFRLLSLRAWAWFSNICINVKFLDSCFKTGRLQSLRQHFNRNAILDSNWSHCILNYNIFRKKLHFWNFYLIVSINVDLSRANASSRIIIDYSRTNLITSVFLLTISRII